LEALLLLANDLAVFGVVIGLVLWFRYQLIPGRYSMGFTPQDIRTFFYVVVFSLLILAARGLYPGWVRSAVVELKQIVESVTLAFILTTVIIFIQGVSINFSRSTFILSWLFSLFLLPVGRFMLRRFVARFSWWGSPVVIIGSEPEILHVAKQLNGCPRLGLRPVLGLALGQRASAHREDFPVLSWSIEAQRQIQAAGVRTDVLTISSNKLRQVYPQVFEQVTFGFRKTIFLIEDDIYCSMMAQPVDIAGRSALLSNHSLLNPPTRLSKLLVSLVLSLLFFVPALVAGCLIACWIRFDSPGSVFFRQERIGRYRKKFYLYKFRTMVQDSDEVLVQMLQDPRIQADWENFHKLNPDDDLRITRAGRILRRLSLDELPQFINILRGEMSLIGPRPYLCRELEEMGDAAEIVLRFPPGLTGWWQVMGRNNLTFQERIHLDLYYVLNWSLWLDLYIIFKSFWVILFDRSGR
jgi:Undecaprenyl-phosphate galactose phosphotransferase WbaP